MIKRSRFLSAALLILLLGFGLRLLLHDYHGLEGDDGFSLALSRYELSDMLAGLARLEYDIHPPLHFVALKGWIALAGESLLSLRLMNILADTLTGALLLRLAGRIGGRRAALMAGALWVVSPLLIYATYLIRMYSLLALFTTAGTVCLMEAGPRRGRWPLVGAALCGLLAAYTHIVGGLVLVALAAGMVAAWRWSSLRHGRGEAGVWLAGVAAFALAGLLYLPYFTAVWALYQSGRPLGAEIAEASFADPFSALGAVLTSLLAHRALTGALPGLLLAALLVVGSVILWRHDRRAARLMVVMWVGLLGMAALAWIAGMYKARYLAPLVPLLLALVAGIFAPRTTERGAGGAVKSRPSYSVSLQLVTLLVFMSIALFGLINDLRRDLRDDWVAAADFVRQHERPGDRVIVIPDWGQAAFQYHYRGHAPVTGVLPGVSAEVDLDAVLLPLVRGYDRVWLVSYQPVVADPQALAPAWLSRESAALVTEVFPAGMHLRAYDFRPRLDALPADARPLDARFDEALRLHGVYLPLTRGSASDQRLHPPSRWVQVTLYWEALQPGLEATPRVRFTDTSGQVYGSALERPDDLPRRIPVHDWQPGQLWQVTYDLNINPESPPGTYNIEVMVLDSAGNPRPASGADAGAAWVIAGQFVVE